MKKILNLLLILVFIFVSSPVSLNAAAIPVTWDLVDDQMVVDVAKDVDGNIYGLVREGKAILVQDRKISKIYKYTDSGKELITSIEAKLDRIFISSNGDIWAFWKSKAMKTGEYGLFRYSNDSWTYADEETGFPVQAFNDITEYNNMIWVASNNGLITYNNTTQKFRHIKYNDFDPTITSDNYGHQSNIGHLTAFDNYLSFANTYNTYYTDGSQFYKFNKKVSGISSMEGIIVDGNDQFWNYDVISGGDIRMVNMANEKVYEFNTGDGLVEGEYSDAAIDNNGNPWFVAMNYDWDSDAPGNKKYRIEALLNHTCNGWNAYRGLEMIRYSRINRIIFDADNTLNILFATGHIYKLTIHDDNLDNVSCPTEPSSEEEITTTTGQQTSQPQVSASDMIEVISISNSDMWDNLKGKIILKVEDKGKAYYVHPDKQEAYFLGSPGQAFKVMREKGVGISNANIHKIRTNLKVMSGVDTDGDGLSDMIEDALGTDKNNRDTDGDSYDDKSEVDGGFNPKMKGVRMGHDEKFSKNQRGKILLQVENHGEAWYINPKDNQRHFLGRPADAYQVMRSLSLGISNSDFNRLTQ